MTDSARQRPNAAVEAEAPRPPSLVVIGATLRRLCGLIGICWTLMTVQVLGWLFVIGLPSGASRPVLERLLLVQGLALLLIGLATLAFAPRSRAFETTHEASPRNPWPIMLAGLPMLPFALAIPLLLLRKPLVRGHPTQPLRRSVLLMTAAFATIASLAAAASAALLVIHGGLDTQAAAMSFGASITATAPWSAVVLTRGQAMLAPFRNPVLLDHRPAGGSSLIEHFGGATAAILIGMVATPILGVTGYAGEVERVHGEASLRETASEATILSLHDETQKLGRFLAEHPDVAVQRGGQRYGKVSLFDAPDDAALYRISQREVEVLVARRERASSGVPLAIITTFFGVGIGLLTILGLMRSLQLDLTRAAARIRSVTDGGRLSEAIAHDFSSEEINQLVNTLGGLVTRITETNVARYVAIERANETDRLKSQFLANMSHDLRSPLNSILGFSELLLSGIEGPLAPDQRELVQTIYDNGRTLLQQIDDILDTAKIDAGRLELHPEPTPPAALIARATKRARARFEHDIELVTNLSAGLPPVYVDPFRTVQGLENVLVFASEPLRQGTLIIDVTQRKHSDDLRYVVIKVRSPMPMPSQEELNAVQRGFSRLPGHSGLGLTLSIADAIFELASGTLHIGQSKNLTEFTIELPAPRARRKLRLQSTP